MSKYSVNRFMRLVNMDPPSLAAYRADPAEFVQDYAAADRRPAVALAQDEHRALVERDYGTLYAMGAHPYLLWSFTEAACVPPMPRAELVESFRVAAAAVGYPDWSTTPAPTAVARLDTEYDDLPAGAQLPIDGKDPR